MSGLLDSMRDRASAHWDECSGDGGECALCNRYTKLVWRLHQREITRRVWRKAQSGLPFPVEADMTLQPGTARLVDPTGGLTLVKFVNIGNRGKS